MDIKCIFYGQFDVKKGPVLTHQIPTKGFITSETFYILQNFVLPDKDLCGKLTVL